MYTYLPSFYLSVHVCQFSNFIINPVHVLHKLHINIYYVCEFITNVHVFVFVKKSRTFYTNFHVYYSPCVTADVGHEDKYLN